MNKIPVGIIGFGRMGRYYLKEFQQNQAYEVAYICDLDAESREVARKQAPQAQVVAEDQPIFDDKSIQVVVLCTTADARLEQIRKAVATGKHIIAEKPISDTLEHEWEAVQLVEQSPVMSTANMYLQNAWYHHVMREAVDKGEIGELAIMRICHMTPGLAPGEGHESEGPSFHDCGMHYVNLARWYARSEYKTWHAQGIRMWDWKDPWWLQAHGTFENGIVYDITQGFVYGQLSKEQTHNSYVELIGTKGFCRMTHDFKTAVVDIHGVTETQRIERPYGGKNLDRLIAEMADSIQTGVRNPLMPTFRDSAIASENAWHMVEDARKNDLPSIGTHEELEEIWEHRRNLKDGYGLLPRLNKNV
ncbi:MAG: Gfo/Idh/MocA family oxidoreductase [Bacteroidaceae bacterium]|nr:Gfo/Idh/MocA family oxidoreductase [Bacteroidaceae bacterium]